MAHWRRLFLLAAAVTLASAAVWGAEAEPTPRPKAAEFDELFGRFKEILAALKQLRREYIDATAGERLEIERRAGPLLAAGAALRPRLVAAAEAAFLESPDDRGDLADFLRLAASHAIDRNDFDRACRLIAVLEDGGAKEGLADFLMLKAIAVLSREDFENAYRLIAMAVARGGARNERARIFQGTAAFATGHFDEAAPLLAEGVKSPALRELPREVRGMVHEMAEDAGFYKQAWEKEQALRRADAAANLPRVLLKTSKGDIEIELFEDQAPNTVANFVSLVQQKLYDGGAFHRVLPWDVAQAAPDPARPPVDYQIPCECVRKDRRVFFRGTVGMAHRGRDTGSASFFIALRPIHRYDGEYTAFGRVVKGMEVLARLQRRDPDKADAPDPDAILTATVLRKRPHPYVFRKVGEAAPESGDKKLPKLPPPAQGPEPGAGNPAKPQAAGRAESKPAAELHVPAKPQAAKSPPPAP